MGRRAGGRPLPRCRKGKAWGLLSCQSWRKRCQIYSILSPWEKMTAMTQSASQSWTGSCDHVTRQLACVTAKAPGPVCIRPGPECFLCASAYSGPITSALVDPWDIPVRCGDELPGPQEGQVTSPAPTVARWTAAKGPRPPALSTH